MPTLMAKLMIKTTVAFILLLFDPLYLIMC